MDVASTDSRGGDDTGALEIRAAAATPSPARADEPLEPGLSRRTVVGIWALVVVFAIVTLLRSAQVGVPIRDPGGTIVRDRLVIEIELVLGLVVVDALIGAVWRHRSLRAVPRVLRERWPWRRVWPVGMAIVVYQLLYGCYRNLKSWDAFRANRDHDLMSLDRALFGGHTPALLLHDLLGEHTSALVLADVYNSFPKLVTWTVAGTLIFVRPVRRSYLFLAAMMWTWVLGTASYYLIPSLGPFATSPQDFAGLTETAVSRSQHTYLIERSQLLADPGAHDSFASISAFASLHVGITCTIMLMTFRYGRRALGSVLAVYLAAIMVSTIYVGMHFVLDDIAGVLIAVAAVWLGQLTVGAGVTPRRTPAPATSGSPA